MSLILSNLTVDEFIHPLDRDAMNIVNKVPGFETLTKFIVENSVEMVYNIQLKGSTIRLTENNSPRVYRLYKETAEILGVQKLPELYLTRGYKFLNRIIGYSEPMILLHTNCIENLDDEQLKFVLGRCLSGIILKHNKLEFLCDIIDMLKVIPVVDTIAAALALPLSQWHRKSELSRDRGGLLACQNFEAAMQVMMLMSGVPYGDEKNIDIYDYVDQAVKFRETKGLEKAGRVAMTAFADKSWMIDRASELFLWHDMGKYDEIIMNHE